MSGDEFRERVEAAFMKHEGKKSGFGAIRWFAGLTGSTERSVWAWCQAFKVRSGGHMRVLALYEALPKNHRVLKQVEDHMESWGKQ